MQSEKQYIDLYEANRQVIFDHSAAPLNAVRDRAFDDFRRQGFPSRKQERYKYTDIQQLFEPDYGLNLKRIDIPVNPYDVFSCDVPNLSTSLYFVVNDSFYTRTQPKVQLPEAFWLIRSTEWLLIGPSLLPVIMQSWPKRPTMR